MRFFVMCMHCQSDFGRPSFEPIFAESFNDRIIRFTCSLGHDSYVLVQSPKFELLLDSGATALNSGFTMEAVGAYSAALERFFEFSTRVISNHLGIGEATFSKMFQQMISQSERQLGAFMLAYALLSKEPFVIKDKMVSFRNKVIHRDYIPTREETFEYCSSVYQTMLEVLRILKCRCEPKIHETVMKDLKERHKTLPQNCRASTYAGGGILSLSHETHKETFRESYSSFVDWISLLDKTAPALQSVFDRTHRPS